MTSVNFYKIQDNGSNLCFTGSSCRPLDVVLQEHEQRYREYLYGVRSFESSFAVLEKGNYSIVLIDNQICNKQKRDVFDFLHSLNEDSIDDFKIDNLMPGSPMYIDDFQNDIPLHNEINTDDFQNNIWLPPPLPIEFFQKRDNKISTDVKEQKKLDRHKVRYYRQREEILAKKKEYYIKNKEKLRQKKPPIKCYCGGSYIKHTMKRHMECKMHISFLNQQSL